MNNVSLVGRLTKEPELKYTPSGVAVCNFTLAVNRPFKNANGESEADFIMVQVWRKPAENAANFLKKGSQAAVNGRINTRHTRTTKGIVFILQKSSLTLYSSLTRNFKDRDSAGHRVISNHKVKGAINSSLIRTVVTITQNQSANEYGTGGGSFAVSDEDLPF